MKRRAALRALASLLAVAPLLFGMGGGGAPSSDTIPRPKENYRAELLDRQGIVTRVSDLSCNLDSHEFSGGQAASLTGSAGV